MGAVAGDFLSVRSDRGNVLEILPARPWYTNLDIMNCNVKLNNYDDIDEVVVDAQGVMIVKKMIFGHGPDGSLGYHPVTKEWKFWNKRKKDEHIASNSNPREFWRFNLRIPLGTCPLEDAAHASFPPSLGLASSEPVKDFETPNATIEYSILTTIKYKDGFIDYIKQPVKFAPLPICIGSDARVLARSAWAPQSIQHRLSHSFKDALQMSLGDLHLVFEIPDQLPLLESLLGFTVDAKVTMTWIGKPENQPELTSLVPEIVVLQGSDVSHANCLQAPGGPTANRKIAQFWGEKIRATSMIQSAWTRLSPNTSRRDIRCKFLVLSKHVLQPTFSSCLISRSYEMMLNINFDFPKSILKRRVAQMKMPIRLVSTLEAITDITKLMHDPAQSDLLLRELSLNNHFMNDSFCGTLGRRPSYIEALGHIITPAPMSRAPVYPELSAEEADRVPAWQGKADAVSPPR